MTNIKDTEIHVTIGYIRTQIKMKHIYCHVYQKWNINLHHVTLTDTYVISGLNENLIIMTQALKKRFPKPLIKTPQN